MVILPFAIVSLNYFSYCNTISKKPKNNMHENLLRKFSITTRLFCTKTVNFFCTQKKGDVLYSIFDHAEAIACKCGLT